jgi:hypothetical protein
MEIRCDDRGWFVTAEWMGVPDVPVFEPRNGDPWLDLADCLDFVKENED